MNYYAHSLKDQPVEKWEETDLLNTNLALVGSTEVA
jgi:hypothetical protein